MKEVPNRVPGHPESCKIPLGVRERERFITKVCVEWGYQEQKGEGPCHFSLFIDFF